MIIRETKRGRRPKFAVATMDKAIELFNSGQSGLEVARTLGVPQATIYLWISKAKQKAAGSANRGGQDSSTEEPALTTTSNDSTNEPSAQGVANTQTQEG
jgi:transposase-like protein